LVTLVATPILKEGANIGKTNVAYIPQNSSQENGTGAKRPAWINSFIELAYNISVVCVG
jgi:hypothetical protein